MTEDQILYASSALCFLLVLLSFRYGIRPAIINLAAFGLYSFILYYTLIYKSSGGSGLLWYVYLLALTASHIVVLGIYLLLKAIRKR